jgi:A/G-specific adenine glycosylase
MLQQTGTGRVWGKYEEFLKAFPDPEALARARLKTVLRVWSGLGYNGRALRLKEAAKAIMTEHGGTVPRTLEDLLRLPGIGRATACALLAFAFNTPHPFIETNIRRVFIHFFFSAVGQVRDSDILPLVEATLDRADPREWYYALMDYGAMLKRKTANPNRKSAHYHRQSPFMGSTRQMRGMILETLLGNGDLTARQIAQAVVMDRERVEPVLARLVDEGFLRLRGSRYSIR